MKKIKIFAFFILIFSSFAYGVDNSVVSVLTNQNDVLFLKTTMPDFLNSELISVLKTGIDLTIVYAIYIKQNSFPFSKIILKQTYKKTLSYNVQSGIYSLKSLTYSLNSSDLTAILQKFYGPDFFQLVKMTNLKKNKKYYCRFKIELEPIKLYPPLSLVFNLIDVYNFNTKWITLPIKDNL